jgi:hypothetical protein
MRKESKAKEHKRQNSEVVIRPSKYSGKIILPNIYN